ncbi:MAG: CdaR family protein, partial [Chloroflexota bacterium]|nr:CdaR family protein [Chloroflexota bacterium]
RMRRLLNFLLRNWPLKLGAVLLASVLYSGLVLSQNVRTFNSPVQIEALRQPPNVALLTDLPPVTEIRYRAPLDVGLLTPDSFSATVDLQRVRASPDGEGVEVPVNVVAVDRRVTVVDHSPRTVRVRLDPVETRTMLVDVILGAVPEGLRLGTIQVNPPTVDVRGASSRVAAIRAVVARVPIDASGINVDRQFDVVAIDEQGNQVTNVVLDPARVHVRVPVARELANRTLPVIAELTGDLPVGYRIGSVDVTPPTVAVSGEEAVVTQMDGAHTEPIDLTDRRRDFETLVPLALPAQVTASGSAQVRVAVTIIEESGTRSFQVGVAPAGARPDRLYVLGTPALDVVLGGLLSELDGVDASELLATVAVGDLEVGTHSVAVEFGPVGRLTLVSITPPRISVTVEAPAPTPMPTPEDAGGATSLPLRLLAL